MVNPQAIPMPSTLARAAARRPNKSSNIKMKSPLSLLPLYLFLNFQFPLYAGLYALPDSSKLEIQKYDDLQCAKELKSSFFYLDLAQLSSAKESFIRFGSLRLGAPYLIGASGIEPAKSTGALVLLNNFRVYHRDENQHWVKWDFSPWGNSTQSIQAIFSWGQVGTGNTLISIPLVYFLSKAPQSIRDDINQGRQVVVRCEIYAGKIVDLSSAASNNTEFEWLQTDAFSIGKVAKPTEGRSDGVR